MSKQSTVVVLHDALEQIESNPKQFVKGLVKAIKEFSPEETLLNKLNRSVIAGNHCNAAEVVDQSDNRLMRILLVGQNTGIVLTKENSHDYQHFIKDLLVSTPVSLQSQTLKLQPACNEISFLEAGALSDKKLESFLSNNCNNSIAFKE